MAGYQNASGYRSEVALPAGVQLGDYRILHTLGQGGFGITYLAESSTTGKKVVIKENLPTFCACRNSTRLTVSPINTHDPQKEYEQHLRRFVDEARLLSRLNHPNIVKVDEAFESLGTAYYVMPWIGGQELQKAAPAPAEITEQWLLPILRDLLGALQYLHNRNIYHRDVKPANILLTEDATPILIDFGTARAIISERSATHIGSPGYSPIEQLQTNGRRGPWTDVYSLGATCYRLITGKRPADSMDRLAQDDDPLLPLRNRAELRGRFSPDFLSGIDKALAQRARDRWQSTDEWLAALPAPAQQPPPDEPESRSFATTAIPVKKAQETSPRPQSNVALILLIFVLAMSIPVGNLVYRQGQATAKAEAARKLAREKAEAKEKKDRKKAARIRQAAEDFTTGYNYYNGTGGCSVDYNKAVYHYRKAAEQGHAGAQCNLGFCYEYATGVTKDLSQAVHWYRKAADQGNPHAQCNLGFCYEAGTGVNQDHAQAVHWYRKAAEQGHARAQNNLGLCYEAGTGVNQDHAQAVHWYQKAAEQGHARAQSDLGFCYDTGRGVNQDHAQAVHWYRKAAEQGEPYAQFNLGLCYEYARGVTKDLEQAVQWYTKAARQGHADAQSQLRRLNISW